MDHYSTLGVSKNATDDEIKKAYRQMTLKYHPDRNQDDPGAADQFKKIAAAYEVLSDLKKKAEYDGAAQKASHDWNYNFNDDFTTFSNNFRNSEFRRKSNERARASQGKTHMGPIDTSYLDINLNCEIDFKETVLGKKVDITFTRKKIVYTGAVGNLLKYVKEDEEKEIKVNFDLRKTYLQIKKEGQNYVAKVRVSKFGNEDVSVRPNIWGDMEQYPLTGELYITVTIIMPPGVELENNNIIHRVEIPLYKAIIPGEKVEIETVLDKKYEAEIKSPTHLNDLKLVIKEQGIADSFGTIGDYIVRFSILAPRVADFSKSKVESLRTILVDSGA